MNAHRGLVSFLLAAVLACAAGPSLTRRLGITQVPALVSQEGLRLRIDELAVSP